jgi:hypothetical protein
LNANREDESLGSGCVEAKNDVGGGNFVKRVNVPTVPVMGIGQLYI